MLCVLALALLAAAAHAQSPCDCSIFVEVEVFIINIEIGPVWDLGQVGEPQECNALGEARCRDKCHDALNNFENSVNSLGDTPVGGNETYATTMCRRALLIQGTAFEGLRSPLISHYRIEDPGCENWEIGASGTRHTLCCNENGTPC